MFSEVFLFIWFFGVFFFFFINLAGQLSQSAHLALQLPYNVLGLGRSANFLDHLYVGIPRPSGEKASKQLIDDLF